jgi:UDP-N-acetylmuramoyl-tripeptide--D-alanyl-D-alanine ligase
LLRGDPDAAVDSFGLDSRKLSRGSVFFALHGRHADGHDFLPDAARAGAVAAVIERPPEKDLESPPALIRVDDSAAALSRCGAWVRSHWRSTRWIAVTGSNGKTTTKEMIAEGLSGNHRVHRTPGNLNNQLGVPLTMLALPDDAEYAVCELAMSGPGEIAELARLTDPDVGLVTNVRAVHMQAFESLDDVAAAKGELYAVMRDDAVAVVNLDDIHVRIQAQRHIGRQVTFGHDAHADLVVERIENRFVPGATLWFRHAARSHRVRLRIGGAHAALDALAALAAIHATGEPLEPAAERIETLEAGPGRGRVHRLAGGMVLVDDSYNSSPPAVASVLETLRLSEPRGRRVLVFGDMLELGPMEKALHREAGRRAAAAGVTMLVAVGPLARETAEAGRRAGLPQVHHYPDSSSCAESLAEFLRDGDLIVVKGSRRMRMERVVEALLNAFEEVH